MSRYLYLAACLPLAAGLLLLMRAWYPSLTRAEASPTARERATLLLAVGLGALVAYGPFLTGSALFAYRDAGLDTVDLYVPFYLDLLDSLREGTLGAWNFSYGLGASVVSYQSWLLDPFNLVLVPLGLLAGNENLGIVLALVQVLKIALSALAFDCLAARFCETPLARALGSFCYGFCGYAVLWGQHYWLGGMCFLFALTLLCLERLAERWSPARFLCVAAVAAVVVGWSPYCGFMVLLCAAVYMLLRLIHLAPAGGVARFVLRGTGRLLAPVLCGCLVACATLVPYALYLTGETTRVASDSSLAQRALGYATGFVPLGWLPALASRLLGSGLITSGEAFPEGLVAPTDAFPYVNGYEFLCLGFGALALVLLLQFAHWVARDASRRDRALVIAAAVLVALYCVNYFLPALLNIFSAPKYRSSFALAVPVCLALAVGWERRVQCGRVARVPLLVGGAASAGVVVWSLASTVDGALLCVAYLACVVAGVAALAGVGGSRHRRAAVLCACGLVAAGVLADAVFVTSNRYFCTRADFPSAGSDHVANTEAALAWVEAQDDSYYRVEKTYADWGLYSDSLIEGYHSVNGYNSTGDGDVVAYLRAVWPSSVGASGASVNYMDADRPLAMTGELGVRYLLSREHQSEPFELVATFGDVMVYRNDRARGMLSGRAGAVGESSLEGASADEARELMAGRMVVPDEVAKGMPDGSGGETLEADLSLEEGQVVTGTFEASADSIACLLVPYSEGWSVFVDGEEAETFRANVGFVGFEVAGGAHVIEARYSVPGMGEGLALGGCGVAATGLCVAGITLWRRSGRATSSRSGTRA